VLGIAGALALQRFLAKPTVRSESD
jgi:hypothetical protein